MSDEGPSVAQLTAEVERLRGVNERVSTELAKLKKEYGWKERIVIRAREWVAAGPDLTQSLDGYFEQAEAQNLVPQPETKRLAGAIIRRAIRVRVWMLLGAALVGAPTLYLLWAQNQLMADQNQYFQEQTKEIRELTEQQIEEARLTRRSQLLATIYDRTHCDEEDQAECRHVASERARRDAAESLVKMADVKGRARLSGADFQGADLFAVTLSRALLPFADFHGANLSDANLSGANLNRADLSGAVLSGAILSSASLYGANLNGADLNGDKLDDANGLTQVQIDSTRGSSSTKLPSGLTHPCWWEGVECDGKPGDGTPPDDWPGHLPED